VSGSKPENYIGLMSGTSLDGVDGVIANFEHHKIKVLAHAYAPFSPALRAELLALNTAGDNELHRAALAENALARSYAQVVAQLLQTTNLDRHDIAAIGAHGQTVRHRPQAFDADPARQIAGGAGGYTLQLNNPALLAELTGIDVVADFRRRDVAAGGQGAPLVPAFHQAVFGGTPDKVAVLNIGGISNVTLLNANAVQGKEPGDGGVSGFDCGPGNALMDHWCQAHTSQPFDDAGRWAASGKVHADLLASLLDEPYFSQPPPKSTGRDLFNVDWLTGKLAPFKNLKPVDVQATLTELTARVCCDALRTAPPEPVAKLIVCGGGALNAYLMARLGALSGVAADSSERCGLPPLQVEAAAFAWLARKCNKREAGNVPKVTGAQGARILGAIYPA
jgi:anhydro-N-acetylmuramic acid kinase